MLTTRPCVNWSSAQTLPDGALVSSSANQHVVKAIVNLAQGFGCETIAEGVEDSETLNLLEEFGVDFAQGFYLGRPAPLLN